MNLIKKHAYKLGVALLLVLAIVWAHSAKADNHGSEKPRLFLIYSTYMNDQGQEILRAHSHVPKCITPEEAKKHAKSKGRTMPRSMKIYCGDVLILDGETYNDTVL